MEALEILLSWQFIVYSLGISAIMFVFRKIIEYYVSNFKSSKKEYNLWHDLVLPVLPVILGPLGTYIFSSFPYPENLSTMGGKFAFGLIAGLLSGLIYRVLKGLILSKLNSFKVTKQSSNSNQ